MSETSRSLGAPAEHNMLGPDYFAFYVRELADLLAGNLELVGKIPGVARENSLIENRNDCYNIKQGIKSADSAPLFSDAVGSQLSDFQKERLRSLVRKSLFAFTQEVDQV